MGKAKAEGLAGIAYQHFAQCPFYKGANYDAMTITCEAFTKGASCRLAFRGDVERKRWRWFLESFCCKDWESCPHARLMTMLYEEGTLK